MYYHQDLDACVQFAGESSRTTHASVECIDSCKLFASLIFHAFRAPSKAGIFAANTFQPQAEKVKKIARQDFLNLSYPELTGSGYVIESLESALWCFMHTTSFEEAILKSANIGNDADTTAAICGQIAGAFYGEENIPEKWRAALAMSDDISKLADKLSLNQ